MVPCLVTLTDLYKRVARVCRHQLSVRFNTDYRKTEAEWASICVSIGCTFLLVIVTKAGFVYSVDEAYGAMFDHRKFRVGVHSDGEVEYAVAGKSTTTCLLDVTYFPFDSQACYIELNRSELCPDCH